MKTYCKPLKLLSLVLLFSPLVLARGRVSGYCEQGNQAVITPGSQNSSTRVQRSFPACTVNVYLPGTTTRVSLYSDNSSTAKSNPFTASSTGFWFFYSDNLSVDIALSGAGISTPFTIGAVSVIDPLNVANIVVYNSALGTFAAQCTSAANAGLTFAIASAITALPTQSCTAALLFYGSGSLAPAANQTLTLSPNFTCSTYQQCFNVSASGSAIAITGGSSRAPAMNPNWFGADASGVADSLAAFNAAYATGDQLYVPPGTYTLTNEFTMARGHTSLSCAGSRSTIIQYTASPLIRSLLHPSSATGDYRIENCYFLSNNHSTYSVFADGVNGSIFSNLRVEGGLTAAFYHHTGVANTINNLEIHARTPSTVLAGLLIDSSNTLSIHNPNIDGLKVSVSGTDGAGIENLTSLETAVYGGTSEASHINVQNGVGAIINLYSMDNESSDTGLEDSGQSHIFGGSYLGTIHYTASAQSPTLSGATVSGVITIDAGAKLARIKDNITYVPIVNNGTCSIIEGNTAVNGVGLEIAELHGCAGIAFVGGINVVRENGANNAISGGYTPARGDGSLVTSAYPAITALRDGMQFDIQLAHTLQAGVNTYDAGDGSGAHQIRKASNPAANSARAYGVGAIVHLRWYDDGAVFVDMGQ